MYRHYGLPYHYGYYGKREAEPTAEPAADAEADPEADPWLLYHGLGYAAHPYGYGETLRQPKDLQCLNLQSLFKVITDIIWDTMVIWVTLPIITLTTMGEREISIYDYFLMSLSLMQLLWQEGG